MSTEDTSGSRKVDRRAASRLKQERERRAWTQSEIAERVGTSQINVSRWENGITLPGPYYRQKLGELFSKSMEELGFVLESSPEEKRKEPSLLSAPDVPPSLPIWNIPHRRNSFFTGRHIILDRLYTTFRSGQTGGLTLALTGLGGIGKTQIALEYAYTYRDYYQNLFWITASTRDALNVGFVTLATLLKLPGQQGQNIIVQAVKRWLTTHTRWLLILDNVDHLEMIVDFLPMQATGDILLTTRQQALGIIAHGLEVEKMGQDEGVLFLLHRTKTLAPGTTLEETPEESRIQAARIVEVLGGLPLALDQAGAYIEETHCSLSQYLQLYNTHHQELLARRGKFLIDHPDSVTATWQVSFKQIEESNPAAVELLHLCAFFDADAIPEELLTAGASELGPLLQDAVSDPLKLNSVLETLRSYSLIRRSPETADLSIHRLVQAVLRENLSLAEQRQWAERAIRVLDRAFPEVDVTTWTQCQRLLPQVCTCAQFIDEYQLLIPDVGLLFRRAGFYTYTRGLYTQAEPLFQHALALTKRLQGPDHPDTATVLHYLAVLYSSQNRYTEAERTYQQALAIRERVFGDEHVETAFVLNNLGQFYRSQGRYSEAEVLLQRSLGVEEKVLGPGHPHTATTLHNLGVVYRRLQQYEKSESFLEKALAIKEASQGIDHLSIAKTMTNLAHLYRIQKRYLEAEALLQKAQISIPKQDHPYIIVILRNMARLSQQQGYLEKAESLFLHALAFGESILPAEHPEVDIIINYLKDLYRSQGRDEEANHVEQHALALKHGPFSF
ncbi:MAG TPA: tetratricopeptide repeat protein [Ktedonosporobacter sp.]|nr:tetratricopeptide repeat protein [Ktedonosporobacter sp.]